MSVKQRADRRELAEWKGRKRQYDGIFANEIRFSEVPPFGVAAPAGAAAVLGNSLRCSRAVLPKNELGALQAHTHTHTHTHTYTQAHTTQAHTRALQAELGAMSNSLSWGDASMLPSTRKFFDLDKDAFKGVVTGQDGVSRAALQADLAELPKRLICTKELAFRVASHMKLKFAAELRGMQANYPYPIPSHPYPIPLHPYLIPPLPHLTPTHPTPTLPYPYPGKLPAHGLSPAQRRPQGRRIWARCGHSQCAAQGACIHLRARRNGHHLHLVVRPRTGRRLGDARRQWPRRLHAVGVYTRAASSH